MDLISIPIIVVCCYMVGEIYKVLFKNKQQAYKLIPILVAIFGGVMGLVIYFTAPQLLEVRDVYTAIMIGIVSGFTSTGSNQLIKQIIKKEKEGIYND